MASLEAKFHSPSYTKGYILYSWLPSWLHFTLMATLMAIFYAQGYT